MKFIFMIKISLLIAFLLCGFNSQLNVMSPYDLSQKFKQIFPTNGSK